MVTREYRNWIVALKKRYRSTQIKAAVAVNSAMLEFYWSLGADISRMYPGKKRNLNFFENLSNDLCREIDNPKGLSSRNLKYALAFYQLYSYRQQVAADKEIGQHYIQQDADGEAYRQQVVADNNTANLIKVPWGHHIVIIGKCKGDQDKALFYVPQDDRERVEQNRSSSCDRREYI